MNTFWIRIFGLFLLFATDQTSAQRLSYQYHTRGSEILNRWSILYETPWFSGVKNYDRQAAVYFATALDSMNLLNKLQLEEVKYILQDNNLWTAPLLNSNSIAYQYTDSTRTFYRYQEQTPKRQIPDHSLTSRKPILKYFYRTPANLFEINVPAFQLRINPVLNFGLGNQLFTNQRGIELSGSIDQKVYFYTSIIESQKKVYNYVNDYISEFKTFPGEGLYKNYNSDLFKVKNGYDFLNAQAFVGINITKHIGMEFGYGRHFIGHGLRSLFLSDFSNNYLYLKLNTKVWKFQYQNIFAETNPLSANADLGDLLLDKKYFASHYLAFRPIQNIEIGLFESVVFNRPNHFEFQYLNPIILYRTIEHGLGSPDNILIGADVNWRLWQTMKLYAQIIFDEFRLSELITNNRGWWGNKIGWQIGAQYINALGVQGLDMHYELNLVKPYTYGHRDSTSNYTHYLQPLAHPLGANFKEHILKIDYTPFPRISLCAIFSSMHKGQDTENSNWGGNILLPYTTREQDFGNSIGQGILDQILWTRFEIEYQLFHNGSVFLEYLYRSVNSEETSRNRNESFLSTGIRINIPDRPYIF